MISELTGPFAGFAQAQGPDEERFRLLVLIRIPIAGRQRLQRRQGLNIARTHGVPGLDGGLETLYGLGRIATREPQERNDGEIARQVHWWPLGVGLTQGDGFVKSDGSVKIASLRPLDTREFFENSGEPLAVGVVCRVAALRLLEDLLRSAEIAVLAM
jgi:hypothetical protein